MEFTGGSPFLVNIFRINVLHHLDLKHCQSITLFSGALDSKIKSKSFSTS